MVADFPAAREREREIAGRAGCDQVHGHLETIITSRTSKSSNAADNDPELRVVFQLVDAGRSDNAIQRETQFASKGNTFTLHVDRLVGSDNTTNRGSSSIAPEADAR